MKRISVIILLFLVVACKNAPNNHDMMESEVLMETTHADEMEDFAFQNMSKQKLQDLYDLLVLQKNHPEFHADITNQLQEISVDSITILDAINEISIQNVEVTTPLQQLSDSVQTMKIEFDVNSNLGTSRDSLMVIIKNKKIILDNEEIQSTKLMFEILN